MKESIPLNSIISTSSSNNNISEPLLNNNNNYFITNNIINNDINTINTITISSYNRPFVSTNEANFGFKGIPLKKVEDKIICCSKRRKMPKKKSTLFGVILTFCLFLFFSILMTICIILSKYLLIMTDSIKTQYNYFLFFVWVTTISSILSLIDAASADPGRQRGTPIPKDKYDMGSIKKIVGGNKYFLKYCTTCHLIRDVRTFHCDRCGLCIEKHDHHCGYLSNCVGVYNYKKFFTFVIIAFVHVSFMVFICFHFLYNFSETPDINYPWLFMFIVIIMIFGGFFTFFLFWMIVQHLMTIVQNRTTREFIKKKEYKVYNRGIINNFNEALCRTSIKEL